MANTDAIPFSEFRADAARMLWKITRELKHRTPPDTASCLRQPDTVADLCAYHHAMEWLAGVIVDDWGDISIVLELIEMPSLPLELDGVLGGQWNWFVEQALELAKKNGVEVPVYRLVLLEETRKPENLRTNQLNWLYYGLGRGWLEPKKGFLGRRQRDTYSLGSPGCDK